MPSDKIIAFLRIQGYRDTQPRRLVLDALRQMKEPASPYDIQKKIAAKSGTISIVTVYRIVELFLSLGIIHRHPCSGKLSLCIHPGGEGTHAYLHCHDCGSSEEFCSKELSTVAASQADIRGFTAHAPLMEIVGSCKSCTSH